MSTSNAESTASASDIVSTDRGRSRRARFRDNTDKLKDNLKDLLSASSQFLTAPSMLQHERSALGALPGVAADMIVDMTQTKEVQHANASRWVIHPFDTRYRIWWWITIVAACLTGWLEPYFLAFSEYPGPVGAKQGVLIALTAIFFVDIVISFFLAYYKDGCLIADQRMIVFNYMRAYFWWDMLTTAPWELVVFAAAGVPFDSTSNYARYLAMVGLLKLGRMYRLLRLFTYLEYSVSLSLLWITITRNLLYSYYVLHWAACGFYLVARFQNFHDGTWVSQNPAYFQFDNGQPKYPSSQYLYCYYWALVTFTTLGYGDLHPFTEPEVIYTIVFVTVNVVLWAYILGSITLVVSKADEKTGRYRDAMQSTRCYVKAHNLPVGLTTDIEAHVRLYFSTEDFNDTVVLATLPTTLRRRAMRHLYADVLRQCYLFADATNAFLDALLDSARVEQFMPGVDIIVENDEVADLCLLVHGLVDIMVDGKLASEVVKSAHMPQLVGSRNGQQLTRSAVMAELAFCTETPAALSYRSSSLCTVLLIGRGSFRGLLNDFPVVSRTVLNHMLERVEETAREFGRTMVAGGSYRRMKAHGHEMLHSVSLARESRRIAQYLQRSSGQQVDSPDSAEAVTPGSMRVAELESDTMLKMVAARAMVQRFVAHTTNLQIQNLMSAASDGDVDLLLKVLHSGVNVDLKDYDGRTALMVAASRGHKDCVSQLMAAGANLDMVDERGATALRHAVDGLHGEVIFLLYNMGARLGMRADGEAELLMRCVTAGEAEKLRCLLQAGADANAQDYEGSTSLHVAVTETNLLMVRMLVEHGRARCDIADRHGRTPLELAMRSGAAALVDYLEAHTSNDIVAACRTKFQYWRVLELLQAASANDVGRVKRMLQHGAPVDAKDFEGRTALAVACLRGYRELVEVLVAAGANPLLPNVLGDTPLMEACKTGQQEVVDALTRSGARLQLNREATAVLCGSAVSNRQLGLLRLLLQAGADPLAVDYNQQTPLHVAVLCNNMEAAQLLVEVHPETCLARNRWGETPLDVAVEVQDDAMADLLGTAAGETEAEAARSRAYSAKVDRFLSAAARGDVAGVQAMLQKGLHPDATDESYDERTALILACTHGRKEVVALLLRWRADLTRRDRSGNTAALQACLREHENIVELLEKHEEQRGLHIEPALECLMLRSAVHAENLSRLKLLLRVGANPNARDYDKRTALMLAARKGLHEFAAALLVAGADPAMREGLGRTALSIACVYGQDKVVATLLAHGAKMGVKPGLAVQLLFDAVANDDTASLQRLLRCGTDVDQRDYNGQTALHLAATRGLLSLARVLVEEGKAAPALLDRWGRSPEQLARQEGHEDVAEYLAQRAAVQD